MIDQQNAVEPMLHRKVRIRSAAFFIAMNEPITTVSAGDDSYMLVHSNDGLGADELGSCTEENVKGVIRIRSTLRGSDYIDTLIHEHIHALLPMASEEWVLKSAKQLTEMLFQPEVMRRAGWK